MADARSGAQQHGLLKLAGKAEGRAGHVLGFLGRGRLETGQHGKTRVIAVVLLVLAGVAAGVVSGEHHQPAGQASVHGREQRVGGHVEAHVLHGHKTQSAAQSRARRHFHGDLLVDGILQPVAPFAADAVKCVRHFG